MSKSFTRLSTSQQLAEQIRRQIRQGKWAVGASIPSTRELASQFNVSRTTVQKAMQELENQEIVKLHPRRGGIVKSHTLSAPRPQDKQVALVLGLDSEVNHPLWWFQTIVHAVQVTLADSGYRTTVFNFWVRKPDRDKQVIAAMEPVIDSLAGAFSFLFDEVAPLTQFFDRMDLPWMTINPVNLRTHHNFVMADNITAGRQTGRCFVRLGYQRIAVLYDELQNVSPLEKVSGLCQAYLEHDLSPSGIELIKCADMGEETAMRTMREYLKTHEPPHGIFGIGDSLAVGALRACQEIGLRIPQDVGVVGSTGLPDVMLHCTPSLTEVCQPVQEMGRQLALCLLEMIRGGVRRISGRRIACPFRLRDSLVVPDSVRRELELDVAPETAEETVEPSTAALAEATR